MNLNYSSNVPVAGSNAANVGSPSPPRNQQSSSGLSSVSGFGERPPVSPVRNFGVPVMTAEGVPVYLRIIPKERGRGIRLLLRIAGMSQDLQGQICISATLMVEMRHPRPSK